MSFMFFVESVLLGIGPAMDAFSASLANGLSEQGMKKGKMLGIAGTFAFFQGLMPLIGWICVHTILEQFSAFADYIPWIALVLLSFIGGKMLIEGIRNREECELRRVGFWALMVQGVATSIDALSVGFDIGEYDIGQALVSVAIIATITFAICLGGIVIGKKFGTKLSCKAAILGGAILIVIGIEIFLTGILG